LDRNRERAFDLSVVIASYDSAPWLPSTLDALQAALSRSSMLTEVVVVDDGSTDNSGEVLEAIASRYEHELRVLRQENKGRFLARWAGVEAARGRFVLLLDSRVLVEPEAIVYLEVTLERHPQRDMWNGHVSTDAAAPLVGRFWEVPTHAFWSSYLREPRRFEITSENFDRVPKGTGFFFAPRELFRTALLKAWPEGDARLVSDDTRVLRELVSLGNIILDPGFAAIYRPRVTLKGFLRHARDRGTLFVDSYAGTTVFRSCVILALVVAPVLLVATLATFAGLQLWVWLFATLGVTIAAALVPAVVAAINNAPRRALVSYLVFLVPFTVCFWLGLARGVALHRKAFLPSAARQTGK